MPGLSLDIFEGSWFWGWLVIAGLGAACAQYFWNDKPRARAIVWLAAQIAFLLIGLRIPFIAIMGWIALGCVTYRLATSSRSGWIWSLWVTALVFFRLAARGSAAFGMSGKIMCMMLGLSYMALRSISFGVDYRNGKIRRPSLPVFLTYLLFIPSLAAGPIDRYGHFASNMDVLLPLDSSRILEAVQRIAFGAFKKFVLAGFLSNWILAPKLSAALLALSPGHLWLGLYAYAWFLYLDFSAYSDLAIGAGLLFGIRLPENFRWPYFSRNIIEFWTRWHISLSFWLRDYLFMPIGQRLFRWETLAAHSLLIAFVSYVATMVFCGAWHGFPLHFLAWGLYHGMGLFICRAVRTWSQRHAASPLLKLWATPYAGTAFSTLLTFHFVTVGWLLFVYDIPSAGRIFLRIMGGGNA